MDYASSLDDPSNLLYKVYPGYDKEKLLELLRFGLQMTDHPTLGVMVKPGESGAFHVGTEGVRYDPVVSPENVDSLLHGYHAIWCLGGSTTYGHKIDASETFPYYLSVQDSSDTYINLGTPSYHQSTEINKLIILLKKGFRPKKVVFLDGNNDFLSLLRTNFHPAESPHRNNMAYPLSTNINKLQSINKRFNWNQIPVVKLLKQMIEKKPSIQEKLELPYENLNDPNSIYFSTAKNTHFRAIRKLSCDTLMEYYPKKIFETYRMNQQFVDKLAYAYDFEYEFLFQPLGFLNEHNPFISDFETYQDEWACYDLMQIAQQLIRDSIQSGALPHFRDLSHTSNGCDTCFIDLVHYSGVFNEILANHVLTGKSN